MQTIAPLVKAWTMKYDQFAACTSHTHLLHTPSLISGPVSSVSRCLSPCDVSLSPPACAATCGPVGTLWRGEGGERTCPAES